MKMQNDITQEKETTPVQRVQQEASDGGTAQLADNRESTSVQRKLLEGIHVHAAAENNTTPIQRKANKTGLPDNLKSGIENLSGYSMDDVKVHYNSSKPAQLQAHAYAQGTDIHLASGQEKHLPHEAWHVVQQKQGRVQPTRQLKSKVNINDDAGLEKEADVMGAKALQGANFTFIKKYSNLNSTQKKTAQLKDIDPNKLNVIGENHLESGGRRNNEKTLAESIFKNKNSYWEENEFEVLNKEGVKERDGDPIILQLVEFINPETGIDDMLKMYENNNYTNLISKNNKNGEDKISKKIFVDAEIKYITLGISMVRKGFINFEKLVEKHVKSLNQQIDKGISNEISVNEFLNTFFSKDLHHFSSGVEFHNHYKDKIEEQLGLIDKAETTNENIQQLVSDLKTAFKPHYVNNLKKESNGYKNKISGENDGNKITYLRSIYMHEAANKMYKTKGIWKIGQHHIIDILKYIRQSDYYLLRLFNIPHGMGMFKLRKMNYNLLSIEDFDSVMKTNQKNNAVSNE